MTVSNASDRKRPTIDDVAKAAGVSRGTVSRVLNGGHWVSPDAQAAVTQAIKKTGFRANPHARSLATRKANTVAFLLGEAHERLFEDPNFSILMRGAAKSLAEHDISLVLIMAGSKDEQRRAKDFILGGHVDGVLLVSSHSQDHSLVDEIYRAGVPVIACGVPLGNERKIGYVTADDFNGAREMVAYLKRTGCSRIATIAGPKDTSGGISRLNGYKEELGDAYDPALVVQGDYSRESGYLAMRSLLESGQQVDAVFAANDLMARGAIDAITAAGRRVPADIVVAGFDDSPIATAATPSITTMQQPFDRISHEMAQLLLKVIAGEKPATMILSTELVIRESTETDVRQIRELA